MSQAFFEIVRKDVTSEANIIKIPAGDFVCKQISLKPDTDLIATIQSTFGHETEMDIIVSNMLLEKFQIGTKTSELQSYIPICPVKNE